MNHKFQTKSESLQKEKEEGWLRKIFKRLAFLALVALVVVAIISVFTGLSYYWVFAWLQDKIRTITGCDVLIANAIAAILVAVVVVIPFRNIIISYTPFPSKNKKFYRIILPIAIGCIFLGIYLLSQDVYFDPITGRAMKYYSIDSTNNKYEYKFYYSSGFDPVTGDSLRKVTKKVVEVYFEQLGNQKISQQTRNSSMPGGRGDIDGIEGVALVSKGQILNQSGASIVFCIDPVLCPSMKDMERPINSLDLDEYTPNLSISKLILSNQSFNISLREGRHYFALFNVNGENIAPDIIDFHVKEYTLCKIIDSNNKTISVDTISKNALRSVSLPDSYTQIYYKACDTLIDLRENQWALLRNLVCCKIYWYDIKDYVDHETHQERWDYGNKRGLFYSYEAFVDYYIREDGEQGPPLRFNNAKYPIKVAYIMLVPPEDGWKIIINKHGLSYIN